MKEVSFPTPHIPHPTPSFKSEVSQWKLALSNDLEKRGNPDLRRQCQSPVLEIPQMVEELTQYLTPTLLSD